MKIDRTTLMTQGEMRDRLEAGEDALALSLEHWERNCAWLKGGGCLEWGDIGSGTCALCEEHYYRQGRLLHCPGCPLYEAGFPCDGDGSPWQDVQRAASTTVQDLRAAAESMRDVLQQLKEKEALR